MKYFSVLILFCVLLLAILSCTGSEEKNMDPFFRSAFELSPEDNEASQQVFRFLESMESFPKPRYRKPLPDKTEITYYHVSDLKTQIRIADALEKEFRNHSWKPVMVRFMKEEVLHKAGDKIIRGNEEELRTILIQ